MNRTDMHHARQGCLRFSPRPLRYRTRSDRASRGRRGRSSLRPSVRPSVRPSAGGRRLVLEPRQQVCDVVKQQVTHLRGRCRCAPRNAHGGEILPVGREGVDRHLPATLPQACRDVEDTEVGDIVVQADREHRQFVAAGSRRERPQLRDPGRRVGRLVATLLLEMCWKPLIARYPPSAGTATPPHSSCRICPRRLGR